jgi:hypothetical protein
MLMPGARVTLEASHDDHVVDPASPIDQYQSAEVAAVASQLLATAQA